MLGLGIQTVKEERKFAAIADKTALRFARHLVIKPPE
jgi:hypothetical protein